MNNLISKIESPRKPNAKQRKYDKFTTPISFRFK